MLKFDRYPLHQVTAALFFCAVGYLFLSWPVGGVHADSDLWYHLSGGRYFFNHLKIPTDAYFSFMSPAKEWTNYYWLFQVIVFSIYTFSGYYGLILFRALLYLSTIFLIFRYLTHDGASNQRLKEYGTALFTLYALAIIPRELFLVRPHLFSYLFIVAALLIIEQRKKRIWMLPLMCLALGNLHGMEYPIAVLIIVAYLSELFIDGIRKQPSSLEFTLKQRILLILAIYFLFLTPAGFSLIKLPMDISPFLNHAIMEMVPVPFMSYLGLDFRSMMTTLASLQHVIIILNLMGCLFLLINKSVRPSHLILFLGALVLLQLNIRFVYEATLLTLPLAKSGLDAFCRNPSAHKPLLRRAILVTTAVIAPALLLFHFTSIKSNYPFSYQKLPFGTTAFLKHIGAGGRILNENNSGGFVHWELFPKYRIFMDLQMSIFEVSDLYTAVLSKRDPTVLQHVIDTYDPTFVLVSRKNRIFQDVLGKLKKNTLKPIFLDDSEILFADSDQVPDIVDKYGLLHFDPFQALEMPYETMDRSQLSGLLSELTRMQHIYPDSAVINTLITNVMLKMENHENILQYPENIIEHHPENPMGYALMGQVLFAQNRFQESIRYLDVAYHKPGGQFDAALSKNLHSAYFKTKAYKKAYQIFRKSINVFNEETSYKDLYTLAVYAAAAGMKNPSETLLKFAETKTPADDLEYLEKLRKADFWE